MPKPPPKNPVTDEARAAFPLFISEWQQKLGLMDWRLNVSDVPSKSYCAEVYKCHYDNRVATLRLGTDLGGSRCEPETVEALAVHELCHILLKELIVLCQDSNTPDDVIDSAEHRVINTMVRLLVPNGDL